MREDVTVGSADTSLIADCPLRRQTPEALSEEPREPEPLEDDPDLLGRRFFLPGLKASRPLSPPSPKAR